MITESTRVPLLLLVQLTAEQRQHILEQTGQDITVLPYESQAPFVRCEFGGVSLRVARGVFMPAAATEAILPEIVAAAAGVAQPVVVEVGTGCGAIALAIAKALPHARVFANDTSELALKCARRNRKQLRLPNVRFLHGSLLARLPAHLHGQVRVIVGNLPYLPPRLAPALAASFPPDTAIGSASDGLGLPRQLAADARAFLQPRGSLVLQLGAFQWPDFAAELVALGYETPVLSSNVQNAPVAGRSIWPG